MGMTPIPGILAKGPPKCPVITSSPFFSGSTKRAGAQDHKNVSPAPKNSRIRMSKYKKINHPNSLPL
jgi:hypothetical protein